MINNTLSLSPFFCVFESLLIFPRFRCNKSNDHIVNKHITWKFARALMFSESKHSFDWFIQFKWRWAITRSRIYLHILHLIFINNDLSCPTIGAKKKQTWQELSVIDSHDSEKKWISLIYRIQKQQANNRQNTS